MEGSGQETTVMKVVLGLGGAVVVAALALAACGGDDDLEVDDDDVEDSDGAEEAGTSDVEGPWPDVDPCSLLPTDALTAAGIEDTDGEPPSTSLFDGPHCAWGTPQETYVNVVLSGPVTEMITDTDELYGQIAGRDTYASTLDRERGCWMTVDNGDYSLEVSLHRTESQANEDVAVCEATEPLAEAALSALE
jgi:hypothetical protein